VSYHITYTDFTGRKIWEKIGKKSEGINEAYCHNIRNKRVLKIRLGDDVPATKRKESYTFSMAYNDYIEWIKHEKKTWINDMHYFKHVEPFFGKREITSLGSSDFEELKVKKLAEGLAPATVRGILGTARQIFNYVIRMKKIEGLTNPISNGRVKMPKVNNKKLGFFSQEQINKLLVELKKEKSPLKYNLTLMLLHTGARFSEVASLTWNDINFDNNLIYFKETKEGNSRYIVMSEPVREVVNELYRNKKCNLLIPGRFGDQIAAMPRKWQKIVDRLIPDNTTAGKYRLTTHSLRHTHASWLAISGMDIRHIQVQLGHRSLEMTERYSHLIPDKRYEMVKEVFHEFR
jgi:integrase